MPFTSPATQVTLAPGSQVALAPGAQVGLAAGTAAAVAQGTAAGQQFQATNESPWTVSGTAQTTVTVLPAPPAGKRYVLCFAIGSLLPGNTKVSATLQETLAGTDALASYAAPGAGAENFTTQFSSFVLPYGAGVSATLGSSSYVSTFAGTLYYALSN